MKKQAVRMVIGIVLIAAGLTGCGKSEKDEIADNLNDLKETASGTDGDEVGADEAGVDGGIPDHLSYSVIPEGRESINVEADVISAGFENAPVYEAEVIEIDEELIKKYSEGLFDNGKYEVIKPYSMFSLQELKDEKEFIIEQMDSYKRISGYDMRTVSQCNRIDSYIWNYDESNVSELAEGQLIYQEDMGKAIYSSSRLRGMVEGEQWELFYEAINGSKLQQSIGIYSCERVFPDSWIVSMDDEAVEQYGENLSNLEESQKSAEDMLKKLGYEDMEVIHTGQIVQDNFNTPWTDGYKFVFARSVGTTQIGFKENSLVFDADNSFGVKQEYIHVYVSDNNVYRVKIDNLVEIGDMLSEGEQNSLLSFDKIDSIAREFMENNVLLVSYMNVDFPDSHNIDSVSLKYVLLPFEEGKYALMPVWIYYLEQPDKFIDYKIDIICINAVDGSIIESEIPSEILVE